MASPTLYFPEGAPAHIRRIVDPDQIHKHVQEGLKGLERDWKSLVDEAAEIVNGDRPWWLRVFGGKTEVSPEWLAERLYQRPRTWPTGLSAEDKDMLRLLRATRDLGSPLSLKAPNREMPPPEEDMTKAFKMMAKDTRLFISFGLMKAYEAMLKNVGKEIEGLCEGLLGESCEDDAVDVVHADVDAAIKTNQIQGMSRDGARLLQEFYRLVYV